MQTVHAAASEYIGLQEWPGAKHQVHKGGSLMADIVEIDAHRPHAAGPVLCFRCEHEWVAVRPIGTLFMECPKCGAERGYSFGNVLGALSRELGDECCGQVDKDGTCAAPACLRGAAVSMARGIVRLAQMEYGDADRETDSGGVSPMSE